MSNVPEPTVFTCRMCGHCCTGKGGIIVSPRDLERLAAHMGLAPETVLERYCERMGGKWQVRCGEDENCIFFQEGKGCSVHEGKPAICRAWPFFRGNLEDPLSWELAKDFCPGIVADADHADFAAQGLRYLRENDLLAHDPRCEANALILTPQP